MEKTGVKNEKVGQRSREEERRAELKRRELEDDEVGMMLRLANFLYTTLCFKTARILTV